MLLIATLLACSPADSGSSDTGDNTVDITAPPLVINEVLASNHTTNTDNAGEHNDWVEIYNTGSTIVQLDGFYLSDDQQEPTKYAMPAGVGINAGGFIAVWCDGQPEQQTEIEYHTNFKLNRAADFVFLNYAEDNPVVTADSVYWEAEQTPDVAAARVPDGSETWVNQAATYDATNGG